MNKRIIAMGSVIIILGIALIFKAGPSAERIYLEPEQNSELRLNSTNDYLISLDSSETYEKFFNN